MDQIDDTKLALTMLEKFKRKGVPTLELPRALNDIGFTDEMGKPFNSDTLRRLRAGTIKAFSKSSSWLGKFGE